MSDKKLDQLVLPPQSVETESALLGAMMIEPEAMPQVADILRADDFYERRHQEIFEAMLQLYEKRRPIDIVTVSDNLRNQKKLEDIGGVAYLTQLAQDVPSSAHLITYAEMIASKATLRRLTTAAGKISQLATSSTSGSVEEILDKAEQALFGVSKTHLRTSFTPLSDALTEAFERIDKLHENKGSLRGIATGFHELDQKLAGLQRSDLVIIAARPSMGKTSFALNVALNAAVKHKYAVGIFSLEMSKDQLVDRLLSAQSGVGAWRLRTGQMRNEDFTQISQAMNELAEASLYIDDSAFMNVMEVRTKARRLQADKGLDLLILDHLQLMDGKSHSDNRVQEMSEISRSLKALAKELNIPVIAISQLSRQVENRPGRLPLLSDLRESGSIEQDADVVMFLYRDEYYDKDTDRQHIADLIIAKHRNGPTGTIELFFNGEQMVFRSIERNRETEDQSVNEIS
jgi:replicative DNA helicase